MKKLLFILLPLYSISLSAQIKKYDTPQQSKDDKQVWDVTKNTVLAGSANWYTALIYVDSSEYAADIMKEADLKMWSKEKLTSELAKMPAGGYLIIRTKRSSLEQSNTKWLTTVIQDNDGNEIYREVGKDEYGNYNSQSDYSPSYYNNSEIVLLPKMPKQFKVFVIDEMLGRRYEYIVKK